MKCKSNILKEAFHENIFRECGFGINETAT